MPKNIAQDEARRVNGRKGGRPRTGAVRWKVGPDGGSGRWVATRVRFANGTRRDVPLDPALSQDDEAGARELAKHAADLAAGGSFPSDAESVSTWVKRWLDYRQGRGLRSAPDVRSRMKRVLRVLGERPIARVTKSEVEDVRDLLDREVSSGDIAAKTAAHHWSDLRCMFRDAVSCKERSLRVRTDDPTTGIQPPDKGPEKAKPVLYPSEIHALLSSDEVPVTYRVLYAVAIYTGLRAGELEALEVQDVDLEHGFLRIDKAVSRKTGELGPTKTDHSGDVPIELALRPLIECLVEGRTTEERKGERLLWLPTDEDRAERLRIHLRAAGVTRPALFADDVRHKPIWFHDTRSTHLTLRAVRGDSPIVIQAVARHTTFQTTLGYVNRATLMKGIGEVFAPLPGSLLELAAGLGQVWAAPKFSSRKAGETAVYWRPQRELNCRSRRRCAPANRHDLPRNKPLRVTSKASTWAPFRLRKVPPWRKPWTRSKRRSPLP